MLKLDHADHISIFCLLQIHTCNTLLCQQMEVKLLLISSTAYRIMLCQHLLSFLQLQLCSFCSLPMPCRSVKPQLGTSQFGLFVSSPRILSPERTVPVLLVSLLASVQESIGPTYIMLEGGLTSEFDGMISVEDTKCQKAESCHEEADGLNIVALYTKQNN